MLNTETQLYLTDSYLREFEATVLSCEPCSEGYRIILNQTAFFPEGGGQPADHGRLDDAVVLDVQQEGDTVFHYTDSPLQTGTTVRGEIQWERRFDHMQQHTGEHIISGIVHGLFRYDNVGFRLPPFGEGFVSVDFNGILEEDMLQQVEHQANALIAADVELGITFPTKEELSVLDYRSKKELDGPIRLIAIPGGDLCACCGTHVSRSGEVQLVKILSHEKNKDGTRLFLAAGFRAAADYAEKHRSAATISTLLKTPPADIVTGVRRLMIDCSAAHSRNIALQNELFALLAQNAPRTAPFLRRDGLSPDDCRRLCLLLKARATGVCRVFSQKEDGTFLYALASSDTDVRPFSKSLHETCGGRGGGQPELCTGTLQKLPCDILL